MTGQLMMALVGRSPATKLLPAPGGLIEALVTKPALTRLCKSSNEVMRRTLLLCIALSVHILTWASQSGL